MRNFALALLALSFSIFGLSYASAQGISQAQVVASCGTAVYTAGKFATPTIDVNGNWCGTGGGTPAGSYIGQVGGYDNGVPITPTVQNAAYSASNAIGGLQTVAVFRSVNQPSAILTNFWIGSKGGGTAGVTVYVFDTNPSGSTCTDKTAFSLASADLAKLAVAPFALTPATSQGVTQATAQQTFATSVKNQDGTPTANLYVCLVANGSVTPATTTDYVFKLSLAQD